MGKVDEKLAEMGKEVDELKLNEDEEVVEEDEDDEAEDSEELSDEDESDDEEEEDSDSDGKPRKKRKAFIPPPPRDALPQRTTRGLRTGDVAALQDEGADEEFWNQEFFAEEERDIEYETESEPEDRFDADFMESEEEEEAGDSAEEDARAREPKKKTLRPPGYKQRPPPSKKGQPSAAAAAAIEEEEEVIEKAGPSKAAAVAKKVRRTSAEVAIATLPAERTVMVRNSTRQKVQVAEEERKFQEAVKPRRASRPTVHRQLTQAELLAEAARTEIENTRSLQAMVAFEEATRKKAHVERSKYVGPMLRLRSSKGDNDEEKTTLEVRNMQTPAYLLPQTAPPPPQRALCVISGQPAKFRDPQTGLGYADLAAYQELQRRKQLASAARQQQQQQQQLQYQQQQQMQLQQQQQMARMSALGQGGGW